eukprot:3526447-Pyramimonas_sp.AAC.1
MCLRQYWSPIVRQRMCIGSERHRECWMSAALPLAPALANHAPKVVPPAGHAQPKLFSHPSAYKKGRRH